MKILLLNQTFHPDVMATAQQLSDFAVRLAQRGHEVTVVTSRRAYDDPATVFPKNETWQGVRILRLATSSFGKVSKWRRAADFASFIAACCLRLLVLRRPDAVVALTSPPLISFIGSWYARLRRARFYYWVMDLNPDEAIAAGWLRTDSPLTRLLHWMSRSSFRHSEKIIALDRFMGARIEAKGIAARKIAVIPPWSHDDAVRFDAEGRAAFRRAHGLEDKFVVMYSGNHSPCHPLDTLLEAARKLAHRRDLFFCFVGGGSEWRKIKEKTESRKQKAEMRKGGGGIAGARDCEMTNVLCLPYQSLSGLSASLSAADLHVVVMGEGFVGTIHPCKVYNVLVVGAPILYIGPKPSHVSEVLDALESQVCGWAQHGDTAGCAAEIERIAAQKQRGEPGRYTQVARRFSQAELLPRLVGEVEQGMRA